MERSLVDWYLMGKACMWEQITMQANPVEEQTHPLCHTTCHDLDLHVSPGNNVPQISPTILSLTLPLSRIQAAPKDLSLRSQGRVVSCQKGGQGGGAKMKPWN